MNLDDILLISILMVYDWNQPQDLLLIYRITCLFVNLFTSKLVNKFTGLPVIRFFNITTQLYTQRKL